jgi:hypothetical protein
MVRFDKPVTVALGPSGSIQHRVDDPQKAGEVLLDRKQWPPGPDTAKHKAARKAVLKALENAHDHMLAAKARKAFEAAAQEVDILRETKGPFSGR